jgi:hypothetical protein
VIAAAFALSIGASARADEPLCPNGKTVSALTRGHCCWPEQVWDDAATTCAGRPACPQGMTRDGLTCMPSAAPMATAAATATAQALPTSAPPALPPPVPSAPTAIAPSEQLAPSPPPPAIDRKPEPQRRPPLSSYLFTAGGLWALGSGYYISVLTAGFAGGLGGDCNANGNAWFGFVPYVGPFIFAANAPPRSARNGSGNCATYDDAAISLSITGAVFQFIGTGFAGYGLLSMKQYYDDTDSPTASAFISPGAPGAPLGATFTLTNF